MQNMSERHVTWGTVISIQILEYKISLSLVTTVIGNNFKKQKNPVEVLIKFYNKSYTIIQKPSLCRFFFKDIELHQHVRLCYV
jgi:uncharacterized protein YjaZ